MVKTLISALLILCACVLTGCPPVPPTTQPNITNGIVTLAERFALGYAQQALNQAYTAGKVTTAQYDAAESILVQLSNDLNAGGGTLTQAQVDNLINQALVDAALIYAPIAPIGPIAAPMTPVTKAKLHK